jgi:hypothetical protein
VSSYQCRINSMNMYRCGSHLLLKFANLIFNLCDHSCITVSQPGVWRGDFELEAPARIYTQCVRHQKCLLKAHLRLGSMLSLLVERTSIIKEVSSSRRGYQKRTPCTAMTTEEAQERWRNTQGSVRMNPELSTS